MGLLTGPTYNVTSSHSSSSSYSSASASSSVENNIINNVVVEKTNKQSKFKKMSLDDPGLENEYFVDIELRDIMTISGRVEMVILVKVTSIEILKLIVLNDEQALVEYVEKESTEHTVGIGVKWQYEKDLRSGLNYFKRNLVNGEASDIDIIKVLANDKLELDRVIDEQIKQIA